ncbi:hypothetical protein [Lutibacter sp.]|uniref:hypothetical protein n=1 Tax=Lutibacter sp. TaxID=1925666 RepID=UPI0025BDCB23|nr:hypothetical protein [Lutibacter sp.]MCF6168521.1 hypothetical protein [Lutibacter sp.]
MKKIAFLLGICLSILSCNSTEKKPLKNTKETALVMYKFSEMALLMEDMYLANEKLKEKILKQEDLGSFPEKFINIHTAVLTDVNDRTASFEVFSKALITNQKAIYSSSTDSVKNQFNTMVNTCVACHETTCSGPIPRIKKLLIP